MQEGESCQGALSVQRRAQGREGRRRARVAGSKVGVSGGALCVREKVEICVLAKREEEPGR